MPSKMIFIQLSLISTETTLEQLPSLQIILSLAPKQTPEYERAGRLMCLLMTGREEQDPITKD